jgi:succinate dehydrogenase/fumarate reductase flavoprotein subunit
MEFFQVMPAVIYPSVALLSCTFWNMNPTIRNSKGEEIIEKYLPSGITLRQVFKERSLHSPFSTRDKASRYIEIAMAEEFKAGRMTDKNGFYLEVSNPEKMIGESPDWLRYRGIDWVGGNQQCNAIFHAANGGLIIDENGQTKIPGLYAIGETAAGPHGADRPGGHMMGASQVFGMLAGRDAAKKVRCMKHPSNYEKLAEAPLERIHALRTSRGEEKPIELKRRLKQVTYENMLAVKSEESLNKVIEEIQFIKENLYPRLSVETPMELVEAIELKNLLTVGEIIGETALMRKESRGSHFREDFPNRDDNHWLGTITVKKIDGKPKLDRLIIDPEWTDRPGDMGEDPWG